MNAPGPNQIIPRRISVKNKRKATVRYAGSVDGTTGIWLGVEWDDGLGKHDGQGYFKCKRDRDGKGASFIRPMVAIQEPLGLLDVVNTVYGTSPDQYHRQQEVQNTMEDSAIPQGTWANTQIPVCFVGFDKVVQKQSLDQLKHVSLIDSYAGALPEPISILTDSLPMISVLDLSGTLFGSWLGIARLCHSLPTLNSLHLNRTRLEVDLSKDVIDGGSCFKNIRLLTLFETYHTSKEIAYLSQYWANLEELHLGHNELTECPSIQCSRLKLLNLQNNQIQNLESLASLQHLKDLAHLDLQNNAIRSLSTCPVLLQVSNLWLQDNCISEWSCIDKLIGWVKLSELRIARNPVYTDLGDRSLARTITVARIPQLNVINRSEITVGSRNGSERYYLKMCAEAILKETGTPIPSNLSALELGDQVPHKILQQFPTLISLAEKHGGLPDVFVQQKETITIMSVSVLKDGQCLEFRVQPSMTIRKFKSIIARAFKVTPRSLALSLCDNQNNVLPAGSLSDDSQTLVYFDIQDGSVIKIHE